MTASILLAETLGDLVTVDIGGATTDIHSVTEGNEAITKTLIAPEPIQKRTVEGDLGLYVNRDRLIETVGKDRLKNELNLSELEWQAILDHYEVIPSPRQLPLVECLTSYALSIAMKRHAGRWIQTFGTNGMTRLAEGKDLTNVKYLIATGGALTRLPNRIKIIQRYLDEVDALCLKPMKTTKILIDQQYVMATLGVLSHLYPDAARRLLKTSLGL